MEESSPWRRPPPLGSFLASRIFSVHFLTARRMARYGDQMRADRVSSIVYTLKKPLLLTSRRNITIYFLPPSTPALFLFRLSVSPLRLPGLFGSFIRKELPTVKRLLSHCERRSSVRIDRVLLFSIRRLESPPTTPMKKSCIFE